MNRKNPAQHRNDLLATIAPAAFLLLWSSGFGVAKVGLRYAEPLTFLLMRYSLIVAALVPVFAIVRPPLPDRAAAWVQIAAVGFLIQSVYFGLAYMGMSFGVSAGVAAVSTQPLLVALAAPWVAQERVGLQRWAGLLLGAAGAIAVVVASSSFQGHAFNAGLLLCIASTLAMAAATVIQRRFATPTHPLTVNLIHYAVGAISIAPVAFGLETMRVVWAPELVVALVWIALANSLVAISLLLFMIRRSEASRVSSLFFLVPPMAALFGWILLGESLSPLSWLGMAVAAAGVRLVSRAA